MSNKPNYRLKQRYAGVCVKRTKNSFRITDETGSPITAVKPGTMLTPFPGTILDEDRRPIPSTGEYFITANTCDPYHVIMDVLDRSILEYAGFR